MTIPALFRHPRPLFIVLLLVSPFVAALGKPESFDPVSAEELAMIVPQVDAEADLEYLYRSMVVNDRGYGYYRRTVNNYRLKVYTANGVKALDVLHLPYEKGESRIVDFAARVTNPDGTVFELGKDDLYERTLLEDEDFKGNAKSFSLPHLEVGSIVDYTWAESEEYGIGGPIFEPLEERWPTLKLRIEIKPAEQWSSTLRGFNCDLNFEQTDKGSFLVSGERLAAFKREPYSPSRLDYSPWVFLLYVRDGDMLENQKFWNSRAEDLWSDTKQYVKPKQSAVKRLAAELFEGAADAEEKLHRAFEYCTKEIKNVSAVRSGYTSEERDKLKDVDSPGETIKRGYGSGLDVSRLFASLAVVAGFEARLARAGNSDFMSFNPSVLNLWMNFPEEVVVLRKSEDAPWRFFDLGYDYLPFETLDSDCISVPALVAGKGKAKLQYTPSVDSSFSVVTRYAELALSEFGDLSGTVSIEYSGYKGLAQKRYYDDLSDKEREERFTAKLKRQFSLCTVSDFKMEGIFTRNEPLVVSYRIEIPNYGEGLGKRVFFQPNIFEYGEEAMFTDDERKTEIVFPFPWEEYDEIWIRLPEGFKLEEAASPGRPVRTEFLEYYTTFASNKEGTKMRCRRELKVKGNGFLASGYTAIKGFFQGVNAQDTHILALAKDKD